MSRLISHVIVCCALLHVLQPRQAHAESQRAEALHVDFSVGAGVGGRTIERPIPEGLQRIGPGYFAAADLAVRAQAWPEQPFSLSFLLRYQTSLVGTVWEHPPHAEDNEAHVRCHHVELGVFPMWRTGAASGWSLGAGAGYAMRVFWPDVHNLQTPRQFITGPYLRPELWLTGIGPFSLRIGPELFYMLTMDPSLRAAIGGARGLAVGAQASIIADLGEHYALELMYRESRMLLVQDLTDVERFITAVLTRKF